MKGWSVGIRSIALLAMGAMVGLVLGRCSTRLVPPDKVLSYNEIFLDKTYVLKEDLKLSKTEGLSKGTVVKVYIESTPTLLKVKCYPIQESREYAIGRMAIYRINDQVDKRHLEFEDVEAIVAEMFEPYDPSKKRKR